MTAASLSVATGAMAQQVPEERPLFEAGVGAAGGSFPDYPASSQNHFNAIPFPYLIYRGQYLQLSPSSLRGLLVNTPTLSLDVSASASFSTSSDDTARQGMPKLDYLGQFGPRLNILLLRDAMSAKFELEVPVRAVLSTDLKSVGFRGFEFAPELAYIHANFFHDGDRLKIGIGPDFATTRLMDYFYQVEPQYVAPGRSLYSAHGGYLGSTLEVTYRYPIGQRINLYGFVVPELYRGASDANSPLFKQNYSVSVGFAVSYSFYRSDEMTQVETLE